MINRNIFNKFDVDLSPPNNYILKLLIYNFKDKNQESINSYFF